MAIGGCGVLKITRLTWWFKGIQVELHYRIEQKNPLHIEVECFAKVASTILLCYHFEIKVFRLQIYFYLKSRWITCRIKWREKTTTKKEDAIPNFPPKFVKTARVAAAAGKPPLLTHRSSS